jgi:hypothetical protein
LHSRVAKTDYLLAGVEPLPCLKALHNLPRRCRSRIGC